MKIVLLVISTVILMTVPVFLNSTMAAIPFAPVSTVHSVKSSSESTTVSHPVFFWFFGFVGNSFYPKTELGLSQTTMISVAKNLSEIFGKNNLVLVTAVNQIPLPGGTINTSMIPTIRSYVSKLKQYASAVYGRLDFAQFNLTATSYGNCSPWNNCPIFNQSNIYVNQLGLNGIWFDHSSQYFNAVGNLTYNQMMQNLSMMFPNVRFIINQTPGALLGYSVELGGYTWMNQTYAAPSAQQDTLTVNQSQESIVYNDFYGHVIMHLDAEGPPGIGTNSKEPMSIFASENVSQEVSAVTALLYNGTHLNPISQTYSFVVPLVGSWTYDGSINGSRNYDGTLYNGLTVGNYARSTISRFEQAILNVNPIVTMNQRESEVGKEVMITGNHFLSASRIFMSFDGSIIESTTSNASGYFSESVTVPDTVGGLQNVTVSDGTNTLTLELTVEPSISEKPASGLVNTNVTVDGSGFSSNSAIEITFNGVQVASGVTNATGNFLATYLVPKFHPGSYSVKVTGSNKQIALAKFKIMT